MAGDRCMAVAGEREESLLLREFGHRAMNDFAVARSALAIARRAVRGAGQPRLEAALDEAGARLDGIGGVLRLLAAPVGPRVDLGAGLAALARAALAARPDASATTLRLDVPELWVEGAVARRVSLIAAELFANACRYALAGRRGVLTVRLRHTHGQLVLQVADDGPGDGAAADSGTGLGSGIVAGLAELAGGRVSLERGPRGAVATLTMPLARGKAVANDG